MSKITDEKDLIANLELEIEKHINNNILIQQSTNDALNLILDKHNVQMLKSMEILSDIMCNVRNKINNMRIGNERKH
jgi:hypothetical protein